MDISFFFNIKGEEKRIVLEDKSFATKEITPLLPSEFFCHDTHSCHQSHAACTKSNVNSQTI